MQVEVRVPTYRRPRLLKRALQSLQAQTHPNWIARVLDDSPSREAALVCKDLDDSRILYEPNPRNLGICRNLDLSFSIPPISHSHFLCVLEDDNFYLPECLSANIATVNACKVDIVLRNQRIERMQSPDVPGALTQVTTYDGQYKDGLLLHGKLFSTFFYSPGANNSSIFWKCRAGLDFSTLNYLDDVVSQERLRTLCIDRNVAVGMDPLIVWRDNGAESLRPKLTRRLDWRKSQIKSVADERAIYVALMDYLIVDGLSEEPYLPVVGELTPERERAFWRSGISVPVAYRALGAQERWSLRCKRVLAQLGAAVLAYAPKLIIDPGTRRLTK